MLALTLLSWWYRPGWAKVGRDGGRQLQALAASFSVAMLLRTLFAPWRRIISYPGAGMGAHLRAAVDNAISRLVGFVVRIFVLLFAVVMLVVTAVLTGLELVAWPLLPPAAIILIIWGLV
jgi:hypothetical protein